MTVPQISAEAKASMMVNLELEINARREKLLSMCEAQVASLQSRLERRVNRIPASKRSMNVIELLDSTLHPPAKLAKAPVAPAPRATRAAPAKVEVKTAAKTTRGAKRSSDESDNKENSAELAVPKKRVKATVPATRTTRAASRKAPAVQEVLSPKSANPVGPPQRATRTRRAK
ncbi:hypothetical protein EJ04DRAFT_568431 [Polyplosphaeria fusca]|uniref:Borealin N-terminal domain-containing protein n=1 Tax=Polyplosphaeria fusca TaxID=682080 RepID=A0A9P4UY49_9PLEO|nr:hypothetical protein EJ04DRAFT_568431 [Polyplosphaeria fusca]